MNRTFQIDNMKCMGCVSTVLKALDELPGCEQASVDLNSAAARVNGDRYPAARGDPDATSTPSI